VAFCVKHNEINLTESIGKFCERKNGGILLISDEVLTTRFLGLFLTIYDFLGSFFCGVQT